jgi:hypothetical protein
LLLRIVSILIANLIFFVNLLMCDFINLGIANYLLIFFTGSSSIIFIYSIQLQYYGIDQEVKKNRKIILLLSIKIQYIDVIFII